MSTATVMRLVPPHSVAKGLAVINGGNALAEFERRIATHAFVDEGSQILSLVKGVISGKPPKFCHRLGLFTLHEVII